MNESIADEAESSFFRRNWLTILCVILGISSVVLGGLLYNTSRSYYYEQNMRRYAIYWDYSEIQSGFRALAMHIRYDTAFFNKTLLPPVIPEIAAGLIDATRRLVYLDAEHHDVWLNIENASDRIRFLNDLDYFPNGTWWFPPDQVYQHILDLNASLAQAVVNAVFTDGEYLYNPGANVLEWNEDMLMAASQTAKNLYQLIDDQY